MVVDLFMGEAIRGPWRLLKVKIFSFLKIFKVYIFFQIFFSIFGAIWWDHMDDLKLKFNPKLDAWQFNYFWGKPFKAPGWRSPKVKIFGFLKIFKVYIFFKKKFCFWHYLSGTFPQASKYFLGSLEPLPIELVMGKHSLS